MFKFDREDMPPMERSNVGKGEPFVGESEPVTDRLYMRGWPTRQCDY